MKNESLKVSGQEEERQARRTPVGVALDFSLLGPLYGPPSKGGGPGPGDSSFMGENRDQSGASVSHKQG